MKLFAITLRLGSAYSAPITLPPLAALDVPHAQQLACRELGTTAVTWVSVRVML